MVRSMRELPKCLLPACSSQVKGGPRDITTIRMSGQPHRGLSPPPPPPARSGPPRGGPAGPRRNICARGMRISRTARRGFSHGSEEVAHIHGRDHRAVLLSISVAVVVPKISSARSDFGPLPALVHFRSFRSGGAIIAATRGPQVADRVVLPQRRFDMATGTVKWFN